MNMFIKKDTDFFELFGVGMNFALAAAKQLQTALCDCNVDAAEMSKIKEIEHEADKHVHKCLGLIEDAFITPIDRIDIIEIVKEIENVTDSIDSFANIMYMMRIDSCDDAVLRFVEMGVNACSKLCDMMKLLKQFKKNLAKINELIIDVNRIEEEGDKLYTTVMHNLFSPNTDVLTIVKKKELYNHLEDILDSCEDVADSINKIIIAKT